jgi:hypothetical protein
VMHDNMNVPMRNPSDADLNRALCSKHHGQCCAKGGVSVQLCGWIRNLESCTGGSQKALLSSGNRPPFSSSMKARSLFGRHSTLLCLQNATPTTPCLPAGC